MTRELEEHIRPAETVAGQRAFFETGANRAPEPRRARLSRFRQILLDQEQALSKAPNDDLHKSEAEAFPTEFLLTMNEFNAARREGPRLVYGGHEL